MTINPLISIIIPTYNRAKVIIRAIDSVIKQTYQNWELIVVDDGSSDNTKEVIQPWLADKRIHYFFKDKSGASSARNLGIDKCLGEYIAFLDSDDEFEKNKLRDQLDGMKLFNNYFSICGSLEIYKKRIKKHNKFNKPFFLDTPFFLKNKIPISASFFMIKKEINIKFNESLFTANDYDFLLRYLRDKKSVLYLPKILVKRHKTVDNIRLSVNPKMKIKSMKILLKLYEKNEYNFAPDILSNKISILKIKLGIWYFLNYEIIKGRNSLKEGVKENKKNPKNIIFFVIYLASYSKILMAIIKKIGIFFWKKGKLIF